MNLTADTDRRIPMTIRRILAVVFLSLFLVVGVAPVVAMADDTTGPDCGGTGQPACPPPTPPCGATGQPVCPPVTCGVTGHPGTIPCAAFTTCDPAFSYPDLSADLAAANDRTKAAEAQVTKLGVTNAGLRDKIRKLRQKVRDLRH